ncbi:phosphofructokinase [Flavobacterium magnum]|uniref:Phosphofructokinase n=1 Tax=Flavobacterium magnum TaxID=2162713 RepID=A0A2S0RBM7_9FLAO|nr:1-phosphofructokinase family hexose kinase [Flavobacterium magnum]AWA29093.1 phosphofructokinase [Flavobacterium magnum]
MKNPDIVTLTVNPSLDKSTSFKGLVPEQKIRCENPEYDAGGGGINVSKAIARLGGESLCIFTSGGDAGRQLQSLLEKEKIMTQAIAVKNATRENLMALDLNTNAQYRFGFPGASLSAAEQDTILDTVNTLKPKFLVASGSLNEDVGSDFYQKMAVEAKKSGVKFIVDTSGEALQKALEAGVYLAKPNIGELAKLVGIEKLHADEADDAARTLIGKGFAQVIVVSLGPQGAVLVTREVTEFIPAPNVPKKSTVGAGDSMVGGMVWALSQGKPLGEVIRWGVACGSAATMNEGTQLFHAEDARRLFDWLGRR